MGKQETFKTLLDNFLRKVPDQPETENLKPDALDCNGSPSNSIYDWCTRLNIDWKPNVKLIRVGDSYMCKHTYNESMGRLS